MKYGKTLLAYLCACNIAGANAPGPSKFQLRTPQGAASLSGALDTEKALMNYHFGEVATLVINKDLFNQGIELSSKGYGNYFAQLESQESIGNDQQKPEKVQKNLRSSTASWTYGGLKVGGRVAQSSNVFMTVGMKSEHMPGPLSSGSSQLRIDNVPRYNASLQAGLGFEYDFGKVALVGHATSSDRRYMKRFDDRSKDQSSKATTGRQNQITFALHYKFD